MSYPEYEGLRREAIFNQLEKMISLLRAETESSSDLDMGVSFSVIHMVVKCGGLSRGAVNIVRKARNQSLYTEDGKKGEE